MKTPASLTHKIRLASLLAALLATGAGAFAQTFTPTDVFWAPSLAEPDSPVNNQHRLLKVNAGGDFLSTIPAAVLPDRVYGQMAFKLDRTLAYLPSFFINRVLTVTPGGVVNELTPFATGINRPTGMLVVPTGAHAGKLLCSSFGQDRILDISAGGDFVGAPSFATGTPSARNILQLVDGTLLVAASNGVRNITAGGASTSYASGFSGRDIVQLPDGRIMATTSTGTVLDITGGGNFSAAIPFATGHVFIGLAVNENGHLLASVSDNATTRSALYDITAGGNFSAAVAFATNLPGESETLLDTVPGDPIAVTTTAATGISGYVATLNGTVNPGGLAGTAVFEYGLTPGLGSLSGTVSVPAGNVAVPVSKLITGLTPNTLYYFRAKFANALYGATGATLNFTTGGPNTPPDAIDDSIHPPANLVSFTLAVLGNDTDVDFDPLTVSAVGPAPFGTTSITGGAGSVTYAPGVGYTGNDTFTYTANDGQGGTDTATVTLHNAAPLALNDSGVLSGGAATVSVLGNDTDTDGDNADFTVTATTNGTNGTVTYTATDVTYTVVTPFLGSDSFTYTMTDGRGATSTATVTVTTLISVCVATGDTVSGQPATTKYKKFGIPSITEGAVAFKADLTSASGSKKAILAGDPPVVVVFKGDLAPGAGGAIFSNFKDPVVNNLGNVAFIGSLSGSGVTSPTSAGLWTNMGGPLAMLARNGTAAPVIAGATLKALKSVAITDDAVFFTGVLAIPTGGVTGNDDVVLWIWKPVGGVQVLLREGQSMTVNSISKTVKSFKVLVSVSKSPGHGRAAVDDKALAHVSFTDGTQAIAEFAPGTYTVEEYTGGSVAAVSGAVWQKFGVPAMNADHDYAFLGAMQSGVGGVLGSNNLGIFAGSALIAREFDIAPGVGGVLKFGGFYDPVFNADDAVAFQGKLYGAGLNTSNTYGLWWDDGAGLDLIARAGEPADGVPSGTYAKFNSLALPDGLGPVFTATLVVSGPITKTNNFGLWAIDPAGALQLLVRTSDSVVVNSVARTVKKITVLTSVSGSPGQGRAYNTENALIYRLQFIDGTQAIMKVQFP